MDKPRDRVVAIVAAANATTAGVHLLHPDPEATGPADQRPAPDSSALLVVGAACLLVAAAVLVGYSFAATAWRARHDPRDLAFVTAACSLLAALLVCLRRAERLAPDSPAGERRRVRAAVWALSAALSCAFAYRVAGVMPPGLAVLVWGMTAFVVLAGFFLLVLCEEQRCDQAIDDEADAAGDDRKAYAKISSPTDEFV